MVYYLRKFVYFFVFFILVYNLPNHKVNAKSEIVLGNKEAKITIIEFASMTCVHCAEFHQNIFPKINEKYIKTGKVKFIFRHFPLDKQALFASILIKCAPDDKHYDFIKLIFKTRAKWISGEEQFIQKLKNVGKMGGLAENKIESCFKNETIVDEIIESSSMAEKKFNISSTPSFIINEKKYTAMSFEGFEKVLDNLIN